MSVIISDKMLQEAGLSECEARIEIACRLFGVNKLSLWSAAKWAGLGRTEFEAELQRRKIPIYRPGLTDLADDLRALEQLGA